MRNRVLIFFAPILIGIFITSSTNATDLCAEQSPLPEEVEYLRMHKSDFTFERAKRSVRWLEEDIWKVIRSNKTTQELLMSTEQFGIPLPNSVRIVKGTIYLQNAVIALEKLKLMKLKMKLGEASIQDIESAEIRTNIAIDLFCDFLQTAEYVD